MELSKLGETKVFVITFLKRTAGRYVYGGGSRGARGLLARGLAVSIDHYMNAL